jgi:hypothetical protein
MVEFIKHTLGLCGEGHPSLLYFGGMLGIIWYVFKHNVKWCWKKGCNMCLKTYQYVKKKHS